MRRLSFRSVVTKHSLLNAACFLKATVKRLVVDTKTIRDIFQTTSVPAQSIDSVVRPVSVLLCWGRPANVPGDIPFVVINSIYGVFGRRSWSDVSKKSIKVVCPFFGNRYAPAAVVFKLFEVRVQASAFYMTPNLVLGAMAKPVRGVLLGRGFLGQASTRLDVTAFDITSGGDVLIAASAVEQPHPRPVANANVFHGRESIKLLPCYVQRFGWISASARFALAVLHAACNLYGLNPAVAKKQPLNTARGKSYAFNSGEFMKLLTSKVKGFRHSALLNVAHQMRVWRASVQTLFGSYPSQTERIVAC